jgi:phosphate/phosphite/phosphonate ABC transporter binding protein
MNPILSARWKSVLRLAAAFCLFSFLGCGRDPETRVVDFSQKEEVTKPAGSVGGIPPLRVAIASMVSPKETFGSHQKILGYIGSHLKRNVQLVQRKTYGEINALFLKGDIDIALICSGPYATGAKKYGFELLAIPQVRGLSTYRAYLIVSNRSHFTRLEDLRDRVFAFTDPQSNTGRLVPAYWLARIGERPETFFEKIIYTYSHDNSILAVSKGLVDGAAVDGLIWEYYHEKAPDFTAKTRVIRKSEPFPTPPFVAAKTLPPELRTRIRDILLAMHKDPEGREVLQGLGIERFVIPKEEWYDPIREMAQTLKRKE